MAGTPITHPNRLVDLPQLQARGGVSGKDYGAVGDGVTDDTAAFEAWLDKIGELSADGPVLATAPNGKYKVGNLPFLSQTAATTIPIWANDVFLDFRGAYITHTGDDHLFNFRGDQNTAKRFALEIIGGHFVAGASTRGLFRFRDCQQMLFAPRKLEGFAGCVANGATVQNWATWSENNTFGGRNMIESRKMGRTLVFQSADVASTYDSESDPGGTQSFARQHVSNIFIAETGDPSLDGLAIYADDASLYDSWIQHIKGNVVNEGGSIIYIDANFFKNTTIENLGFEGATAGAEDDSYLIRTGTRYETNPFPPVVRHCQWAGGNAEVTDPAAGVVVEGFNYEKTFTTTPATPIQLLPAGVFSPNTTVRVTVYDLANNNFGSALVNRRNGTNDLLIANTVTATGGVTFTASSGALMVDNSVAATLYLIVEVLKA